MKRAWKRILELQNQATNETNYYNCANCNLPLHKFIAADRRGVYSYCMDTNCHYSALYDSNYEIARKYFMEHGKNIDVLDFMMAKKQFKMSN